MMIWYIYIIWGGWHWVEGRGHAEHVASPSQRQTGKREIFFYFIVIHFCSQWEVYAIVHKNHQHISVGRISIQFIIWFPPPSLPQHNILYRYSGISFDQYNRGKRLKLSISLFACVCVLFVTRESNLNGDGSFPLLETQKNLTTKWMQSQFPPALPLPSFLLSLTLPPPLYYFPFVCLLYIFSCMALQRSILIWMQARKKYQLL